MVLFSINKKHKTDFICKGMILSEILLAGAIISFALGSAIVVVGGVQSMLVSVQNGFEAQLLARQEISLAHLVAFDDLVSFEKTDGFFTTVFSVSSRNDFSTNILADVFWHEGLFQKHRSLSDQVVDWEHAFGSIDCDWLDNANGHLSAVNIGALDVDYGNVITGVAALGDFVYVSTDGATAVLPDLYVVDVQDIQNPRIVGYLNTGPGIASIAAAGHYVFAANAGSYQMQIIDVVDPFGPTLVAQAKLPGAVISGSSGFGQAVHFFDDKMYIGLVKNAGPELYIVDVGDPRLPIALGSYEIGGTVNDIDVQSGRAIVVAPGQPSVFLLDTSNSSEISEIDNVTFTGWQTQGAKSVEMLGSAVSVGRTLGGFYSPNAEYVLLNRDSINSTSAGLKIGASVEDILGFNDYLYLTTSDAETAFQILHNVAPSASPNPPVSVMTAALSSRGVALTCNSKAMYVVTQNDRDFFHVFSLP